MKAIITSLALVVVAFGQTRAQVTWTEINHSYFFDNREASCMMFDDRGVLYVGSWTGLHVSSDKGVSWSPVEYFNLIDVSGIVQNQKGYLYVAGWRQSGSPKGLEGVWRSKDHGNTWEIVTAQDWGSVRAYGIVSLSDGSLVAATGDGFLRTTDEGDSWTFSNGRFHPWAPYSIQYVNAIYRAPNVADRAHDVLFAQIGGPVFGKSTNGGTVWSYMLDSINSKAVLTVDSAGRVFVPGDSGVYRSLDDGVSWQFLPFHQDYQLFGVSLAAANGWIFGLGFRPVLSTDHGESWTEIRAGLTKEYDASAAIESPDHYVYFVQPTGSLWRTVDPLPAADVPSAPAVTGPTIYPNPTHGRCTIRAREAAAAVVTNAVGSRVWSGRIASGETPIDLSSQPEGPYILRISTATTSITRLIVLRH